MKKFLKEVLESVLAGAILAGACAGIYMVGKDTCEGCAKVRDLALDKIFNKKTNKEDTNS